MFEDHLVAVCWKLMEGSWRTDDISTPLYAEKMTVLHLVAALGYNNLLSAMLKWKSEKTSLVLETEVDALSRDESDATPLVRFW